MPLPWLGCNDSYKSSGDSHACDICRRIHCTHGDSVSTMDGTTCADGAWCLSGKCVADKRAPRAPERCIYGDLKPNRSGFDGIFPTDACRNWVKNDSSVCLDRNTSCCVSCSSNWTINGECKDILDECTSLEPRDCYYDYYASTCCKTCRAFVQNPFDANCRYGDKGTGCSDIVPEVCHLSKRYCCQTCAAYFPSSNTTHSASATSSAQKDYQGLLEYTNVWGNKFLLNCKQLVNLNSSFCYDDAAREYCCASCSNVKIIHAKGEMNDIRYRK